MPIEITHELGEKRDFLEVNKFCVKLYADPLMSLLSISITFIFSAHGPDSRCNQTAFLPLSQHHHTRLYDWSIAVTPLKK